MSDLGRNPFGMDRGARAAGLQRVAEGADALAQGLGNLANAMSGYRSQIRRFEAQQEIQQFDTNFQILLNDIEQELMTNPDLQGSTLDQQLQYIYERASQGSAEIEEALGYEEARTYAEQVRSLWIERQVTEHTRAIRERQILTGRENFNAQAQVIVQSGVNPDQARPQFEELLDQAVENGFIMPEERESTFQILLRNHAYWSLFEQAKRIGQTEDTLESWDNAGDFLMDADLTYIGVNGETRTLNEEDRDTLVAQIEQERAREQRQQEELLAQVRSDYYTTLEDTFKNEGPQAAYDLAESWVDPNTGMSGSEEFADLYRAYRYVPPQTDPEDLNGKMADMTFALYSQRFYQVAGDDAIGNELAGMDLGNYLENELIPAVAEAFGVDRDAVSYAILMDNREMFGWAFQMAENGTVAPLKTLNRQFDAFEYLREIATNPGYSMAFRQRISDAVMQVSLDALQFGWDEEETARRLDMAIATERDAAIWDSESWFQRDKANVSGLELFAALRPEDVYLLPEDADRVQALSTFPGINLLDPDLSERERRAQFETYRYDLFRQLAPHPYEYYFEPVYNDKGERTGRMQIRPGMEQEFATYEHQVNQVMYNQSTLAYMQTMVDEGLLSQAALDNARISYAPATGRMAVRVTSYGVNEDGVEFDRFFSIQAVVFERDPDTGEITAADEYLGYADVPRGHFLPANAAWTKLDDIIQPPNISTFDPEDSGGAITDSDIEDRRVVTPERQRQDLGDFLGERNLISYPTGHYSGNTLSYRQIELSTSQLVEAFDAVYADNMWFGAEVTPQTPQDKAQLVFNVLRNMPGFRDRIRAGDLSWPDDEYEGQQ
jgi:hypothetical protein